MATSLAPPAVERRRATVELLRARNALACPEVLPLAARRDDLMSTIRDHQVVIVAGETGSGKSTQLPKLCLDLGRGVDGLIGHTQPRRVAARTIAERVAEELGTELGTTVGYTVRFTDTVSEQTLVKVMTDGILLAEIQRDRMLRRYDTLIIDEAHERSLNIDFLLGYLAQLLPRRPDLKLIVTSATIDTQRFSEHFRQADGSPAPIIEVSGRTYPVEVRYRPFGTGPDDGDGSGGGAVIDDRDQVQAIVDAVDELAGDGTGDVLVFLSGEREIHDTADALRRHFTQRNEQAEVLPLYARLSAVEQHRIWQPHRGRRVVLSTNVAETSLTVPGVRYVVDTGSVRMSRYSHRLKVQRLPIEPVSQASANQRSGRCGRVAPGVCIRLYDEASFVDRPEFTEPEILRTNLASVILQMTALGLGDVAAFPFLDPPDHRSVRDGYALLEELGAIEPPDPAGKRRLTAVGGRLARLPIDPRLGRMVLEADRHGCVREVMVIAAALSIQDPRERPTEHRAAADELHRRFAVPGSDFLSLVRLWDYLREQQQALGSSQFRKLCRNEYLNYLRVREWQDLFSQLRQVAGQVGVRRAGGRRGDGDGIDASHPDRVHQALLAGLLSHLGMRDGTTRDYKGAHGSKFVIGSGSVLSKSLPKWVIAAELVETNRLYGRVVAAVQPEWAEQLGAHLAKYSYGEPSWDARRGAAVCSQRVSLFGLPIVANRTIGYDKVNRAAARELFIRSALVEGEWTTHQKFWARNQRFLTDLEGWGQRVRRPDLVDSEAVFNFYDRRLGPEVVSTRHFDRWWKAARATDPDLLTMRMEHFVGDDSSSAHDFPTVWPAAAMQLPVTYRFDPGADDDGATVHVPLAALNQVEPVGFDWHVPGFRAELVGALLRGLPKEHRRELVPMNEVIDRVVAALGEPDSWEDGTTLTSALVAVVQEVAGVQVPGWAFDHTKLPPHLRVTFSVDDEHGAPVAYGKDLLALRALVAPQLRAAVAREAPIDERTGITAWDFGDLPEVVETTRAGVPVRGYPALLDDGDSVSIRVFTRPDLQAKVMRSGVRRLLLLTVPVGKRALEAGLTNSTRLAIAGSPAVTADELVRDCLLAAADQLIAAHQAVHGPVFTAAAFDALVATAREELPTAAGEAVRHAAEVVSAAAAVSSLLDRLVAPAVAAGAADARRQLDRLVRPGFVTAAGAARLPHLVRYVKAIAHRLGKLPEDPHRDAARLREVATLEARYVALLRRLDQVDVTPEVIDVGWLLEELRVSVFAQQLGTARPVSPQKVNQALSALGG